MVKPLQGRERVAGGQRSSEADTVFLIRWRRDVTSEHRIVYAGNAYEIVSPPVEVGRREGLEIVAKLEHSPLPE